MPPSASPYCRSVPAQRARRTVRDPSGRAPARLGALAIRPAARQDRTTQVATLTHPIHRVTRFTVAGPYTLSVAFDDGTEQRIDFKTVLFGPLLAPLRELATFNAVTLDHEVGTLVWPNGADFDPATLHDWPDVGEGLAERARAWESCRDWAAGLTREWSRRARNEAGGGAPRSPCRPQRANDLQSSILDSRKR